jgi:hypothetical protein
MGGLQAISAFFAPIVNLTDRGIVGTVICIIVNWVLTDGPIILIAEMVNVYIVPDIRSLNVAVRSLV